MRPCRIDFSRADHSNSSRSGEATSINLLSMLGHVFGRWVPAMFAARSGVEVCIEISTPIRYNEGLALARVAPATERLRMLYNECGWSRTYPVADSKA